MSIKIPSAIILFLSGAYVSINFFVNDWEGRYCWDSGGPVGYTRLPFFSALHSAWRALLYDISNNLSFRTLLLVIILASFLLPILAALIFSKPTIVIFATLVTIVPLAITLYYQIKFGFDIYCDQHGDMSLGFAAMQILIIFPAGVILIIISIISLMISANNSR